MPHQFALATALPAAPDAEAAMDGLGALLGRIGVELDDTAARLRRLTFASEAGRHSSAAVVGDGLVALQDIDLAEQVMRTLAIVLRRLATGPGLTEQVDVAALAQDLPLEAMVRLVRGLAQESDDGELDLF